MTMLGGLEARGEMNGLLDELYGGRTDGSRPGEAREAERRESEGLRGARKKARGGQQPSRVEVVTRQEVCGGERKQVTLIASNQEEEGQMSGEERYAGEPKKGQGLVDKALDKAQQKGYVGESAVRKAREKGFIDKANAVVDRIKNKLMRR